MFTPNIYTYQHISLSTSPIVKVDALLIALLRHQLVACSPLPSLPQGTAAVCLAAVLAALRVTQSGGLREQRVLFLGAGEAAAGIASLMAGHMSSRGGLGIAEARARCFLVDTKGLVCASRGGERVYMHAWCMVCWCLMQDVFIP